MREQVVIKRAKRAGHSSDGQKLCPPEVFRTLGWSFVPSDLGAGSLPHSGGADAAIFRLWDVESEGLWSVTLLHIPQVPCFSFGRFNFFLLSFITCIYYKNHGIYNLRKLGFIKSNSFAL